MKGCVYSLLLNEAHTNEFIKLYVLLLCMYEALICFRLLFPFQWRDLGISDLLNKYPKIEALYVLLPG